MNEMTIVGMQSMSFKTDSGDLMEGIKVYFNVYDPNVTGQMASGQFVRQAVIENMPYFPKVGEKCIGYFNMKGKISGFAKIENK